jgi:AbrB family looped-hinge helix DNA binding protein
MSASTVIGNEGTVEIPKSIREKVHLKEGERIKIDSERGYIRIKKVADIKKIRGAWKEKNEIVKDQILNIPLINPTSSLSIPFNKINIMK